MSKPIIAVDIDDVLFPYASELVLRYNQVKGAQLTVGDLFSYNFIEVWGGSLEEANMIANSVHRQEFLHILPLIGAQPALARLAERFELHIVTSRSPAYAEKTKAWVEQHFPGVFARVDLVGNHHDGTQVRTKADHCLQIGAEYLIDDQPTYIQECATQGVRTILFGDYAWNRDVAVPSAAVRCKDWKAVQEYIDGVS
jgi:5'(3')-deoxyribonucleotidase